MKVDFNKDKDEEEYWQCDVCGKWVHEAHLHNDICQECYSKDHDE